MGTKKCLLLLGVFLFIAFLVQSIFFPIDMIYGRHFVGSFYTDLIEKKYDQTYAHFGKNNMLRTMAQFEDDIKNLDVELRDYAFKRVYLDRDDGLMQVNLFTSFLVNGEVQTTEQLIQLVNPSVQKSPLKFLHNPFGWVIWSVNSRECMIDDTDKACIFEEFDNAFHVQDPG